MPRLAALDGLRGLAAALVFLFHVQLPGVHPVLGGLDAGVLVFFALSGYLLYAPFVASFHGGASVALRTYAVRRLLRIVPAYLVAAFAIAALWHPDLLMDPWGIALTTRSPILTVWTLQLEVAFYVLLPVVAAVLAKLTTSVGRVRVLLGVAAASVASTAAVMVAIAEMNGFIPGESLLSFASFAWAFVPGMVVAELELRGVLSRPLPAAVALVGILCIAFSAVANPPPFFDVTASLGAAALIAWVLSRPVVGRRFERALAACGALSYSVYLWHVSIIDAV
ncbi:MAG TPA: acyltransferase, partial [Candidatus Limnocylindrales bacterium]|nr:acyltransferase [Candidatus Limnocylindrales bacterium]